MNAEYPYSTENRIVSPHKYMYTPYDGQPFIDAYFAARAEALSEMGTAVLDLCEVGDLARLTCRIGLETADVLARETFGQLQTFPQGISREALRELCGLDAGPHDFMVSLSLHEPEYFRFDERIDTRKLVESLLAWLVRSEAINEQAFGKCALRLMQRFEVTKKLYAAYLAGFRKGRGGCDGFALYALCALLMAACYVRFRKLNYLNVLLKMNDTVVSAVGDYKRDEADLVLPVYFSLFLEQMAIRQLMPNGEGRDEA